MRNLFTRIILVATLLMAPALVTAQTAATVTGVVTDASGAALPGSEVVLSNPTTGVQYKDTTNSAGSYHFADVPPGPHYVMTFSHSGFVSFSVKDVYVNVANSRTQNAKLNVGTSETIEVSAAAQTINTEDASIGNNFQVDQLNDLPVQSRTSPTALLTLEPGVANSSVTGARTDQSNITLDGLDVNDFGTGNFGSIVANAPVDSVQEFRGTVAGFQTNSGQGGGGQFQLITKSGTNHFHGNVNEYHRDNSTTANTWFNDNTVPVTPLAKLVRNQFGGAVGGPIKHDKLFFFADVNESRIAQQGAAERTVPTVAYKQGNIAYHTNYLYSSQTGINGCDSERLNDPTSNPLCFGSYTPAQVKALDPAGIGYSPALMKILQSFPDPNDLAFGDGLNTAGYRFVTGDGDNLSGYVGKIDYNLSHKITIYGRGTVARENEIQSLAQFPGQPPAGQFVDRSYSYVVGLNWEISQNKFNTVSYGTVVQDWSFPRPGNAYGVNQIGFSSGTTTLLSGPVSSPSNAQGRHIPIPQVADDFRWTLGRHNLDFGGFFKWINTSEYTNLDYLSDSIGLGGEVQGFSDCLHPGDHTMTGTNTLAPGDCTYMGTQVGNYINPGAALSFGDSSIVEFDESLAVLLGRVGSASGSYNYDKSGTPQQLGTPATRNYRYYDTMAYVGDSWKLKSNLTLNYGLNWQIYSVPWEKNGLETVQTTTFNSYLAARVKQSQAANLAPNGVPFFTYLLGGPANNGPGYYNMSWKDLAPRLALTWQPSWDPKTTFNAGGGVVYDRTVVSAVQYQQDQYSYLFNQPVSQQYGNQTDSDASLLSPSATNPAFQGDPRYDSPPTLAAPATPKAPFTPYVTAAGQPYGLAGSYFNEMVSPDLKTPYNITAAFGMQHEFPNSIIFKLAYAGRFGRRLLAQADSSQLINISLGGQTMGDAFANVEQQVRAGVAANSITAQPFFETAYAKFPKGTHPSVTDRLVANFSSLFAKGDMADMVQAFDADGFAIGDNIGMAEQISENTMYTNMGFSTYHGMLLTLQQNLKHGLKYDFNYTFSHSIDNTSLGANSVAYGGYGFICDALRPRLCRGNSDFDVTHVISTDYLYSLPVGRGRMIGSNMPFLLNEIIGGWDTSGIIRWQSGSAFGTVASAFIAGYANNAPAIFNGNTAAVKRRVHKTAGGLVQLYDNPAAALAAFGPPTGFNIGSRNNLRGPSNFGWDAGLTKSFALWPKEGVNLKLRGDAFNVLNHPTFTAPGNNGSSDDITQTTSFGQLTSTFNGARVVQISGRIEF
jgi:hypothetical protein